MVRRKVSSKYIQTKFVITNEIINMPPPLPNAQDLNTALTAFLQTSSLEEAQQLLAQYPVLLSDEMDLWLGTIIHTARQQGQEQAAAGLDERRDFIRSVRQEQELKA